MDTRPADPEPDPNPYAAPGAALARDASTPAILVPEDAEAIRRHHLGAEASLRALGVLLLVEALLATLFLIHELNLPPNALHRQTLLSLLAAAAAVLVVVPAILGWGLLKLRRGARVGATVIAIPALLAFPPGTLFGGLLLYRMYSKKGSMVFSPLYRAIVAATPQVSPHNTVLAWFLIEAAVPVSLYLLVWLVAGS